MLALGAMAMVLGLSYGFGVAPALAVSAASEVSSVSETSIVSAADVAAAVARAEEAIAKTANATVNVKEVAAMQEYLRGWVAQARTLDLGRLTAAQLKELVAALDEGALGLRLVAGVDRKVAPNGSTESAAGSAGLTVAGSVAEPRVVKELPAEGAVSEKATGVSEVYTAKAEVAVAADTMTAPATDMKASTIDMKTLATLAVAQVKKPTAVLASASVASVAEVSASAENAEVDVPRTGATDEEERTSNAVRGMGLVLAGAVVLAAVGAVLIVKRMKRGL